jgi:hypothetical protein
LNTAPFALILTLGMATAGLPDPVTANTNDVRRYADSELSDLNLADYSEARGECVKGLGSDADCEVLLKTWQVLINSRPKKYLFRIQTRLSRDSRGRPIYKTDDALEYSPAGGLRAFSDDENCTSAAYPNRSVLAIGLWKWRNKPKIGGFAHSIKYAWVIDPELKRFREIPTRSVKCEIDDDRD